MKNAGYLFCFFTGKEKNEKDEQVYFALSRDGLHWEDLNGQKPLLCSEIGTKGVRDPFLIRLEDKKKYIIIATDLHIASGTSWEESSTQWQYKAGMLGIFRFAALVRAIFF